MKEEAKKYKRRFGDRADGRRIRSINGMARVACYIMPDRSGSSNRIRDTINTEKIDEYIREKKAQGYKSFSFMHVILSSYLRIVAQMPAINRFISGQEIFARHGIEIAMTIKKEMTLTAPDTVIKIHPDASMTSVELYEMLKKEIDDYRNSPGGDFDETANSLGKIPRFLMRFIMAVLRTLDYHGHLPKSLLKVSPFHCSLYITSMGSLGVPAIYHHLYDFGNCPLFLSFGKKKRKFELNESGQVEKHEYIDYTVMMDERICDGFTYAAALKKIKYYLHNPWELDNPPAEVVEDIY